MVKGQKVLVSYKGEEGSWWEYSVVINVYDGKVELVSENGNSLIYHNVVSDDKPLTEWLSKDIKVTELFVNGKPAMIKRNIFGFKKFR